VTPVVQIMTDRLDTDGLDDEAGVSSSEASFGHNALESHLPQITPSGHRSWRTVFIALLFRQSRF